MSINKRYIPALIIASMLCLGSLAWANPENEAQNVTANNFLTLAQATEADGFITHTNSDLSDGHTRCGWSIRIPKTWVSIPDITPGWPIAEGWRTPDGKTSIIITWLKDVNEDEYATLRNRRYLESSEKIAGQTCKFFRKINGPTFEQILYIHHQGSYYRIAAFGTTQNKAALQKAMESFKFLVPGIKGAETQTYTNANLAISFSLPHGSNLIAELSAHGINIFNSAKKKVASLTPRSFTAQPGQSFRGIARQIGREVIPEASKLTRFEPYQISGQTGYLVVWETSSGQYIGPIIYVPYKHGSYNVLELESEDSQSLEQFFKIANTLKVDTSSVY
ncbi:MAG: hypothetical protein ACI37J_06855 [Candidatus Bruticola sp.]